MKYLSSLLLIIWLICLANVYAQLMPTFEGVCQLKGDWCTTKCQIAGGSGGMCNKVALCICQPL
ncbi:uncharacterized protein [Drosophila tropicalis]|uniref:uncharacterized protein n=1 Tax=Drosophila tropicalis TaxID=46794 RepID=UPI0035AB8388